MIEDYGWNAARQSEFAAFEAEGLVPARIIVQQRDAYTILSRKGESTAHISGRFVFSAEEGTYPVTGDWVAASLREDGRAATIHHLLLRTSVMRRKAAFTNAAQTVAANVDSVLIVMALGGELNLRRLERTLALAFESGARPAVLLTKADTEADVATQMQAISDIAQGIVVLPVSAVSGEGMGELRALIQPGTTAVLIGPSGAGKSTLVNALYGSQLMATQEVRAKDGRGRHTTSHRELVLLPGGGCLLDTPGMREMGLWEAEAGVVATFPDIEALAAQCHYSNCTHGAEPGCAVRAALADGSLVAARWESYAKLGKELAQKERRDKQIAAAAHKKQGTGRGRRHLNLRDVEED